MARRGKAFHRHPSRRFARPAPQDRRLPTRGNVAPFYLKAFGSRPAYKMRPVPVIHFGEIDFEIGETISGESWPSVTFRDPETGEQRPVRIVVNLPA